MLLSPLSPLSVNESQLWHLDQWTSCKRVFGKLRLSFLMILLVKCWGVFIKIIQICETLLLCPWKLGYNLRKLLAYKIVKVTLSLTGFGLLFKRRRRKLFRAHLIRVVGIWCLKGLLTYNGFVTRVADFYMHVLNNVLIWFSFIRNISWIDSWLSQIVLFG